MQIFLIGMRPVATNVSKRAMVQLATRLSSDISNHVTSVLSWSDYDRGYNNSESVDAYNFASTVSCYALGNYHPGKENLRQVQNLFSNRF